MPIKKLLLNRNVIHGGFYVAALLVALLIYLTFDQDRQYDANTRRLIRTHQVLIESERLYSLLKDCQRGYRGYLLTQDKALLVPYLRAKQTMPGSLEKIRAMTGGDALQQQQRLESLRVLIGKSLAHWDNTLRVNNQQGARVAIEIVKAGRGRKLVDRAYGIIASFQQHEQRQLAGQQARYERSQWTAGLVQRAGGTVGLLLLSFSFVLLRGRLKQKEQWGYQLEAQVRERTRQLEASQAVLTQQAAQLSAHSHGLEEIVRERTRELESKNHVLAQREAELRASIGASTVLNEQLQSANLALETSRQTVERLSAEALRASEQQYRELADSITDPVVMVDGALCYRYVNKAFEQVAGRPAAEIIGKTPQELFGETDLLSTRRQEAALRVFATHRPEKLVSEVGHGKTRKTMEYALYPTANGNVLIITHDITARVEAEQQYKDLAQSLTLPLVVYDQDLRYQYVNRAVEQINGLPASDLIGKTGREVFGELFAPRENVCRQVMETGKPAVYREHPVRDGKRHHWEISVYPTGRGGTLVLNHDITELVEARQQLQEQQEELQASYTALQSSEGRLRKVLNSMFIFTGLFSTDGKLLYANDAPLRAVGVEPGDVLGKPFADAPWFHLEEERQKLRENLARAARGETVRYDTQTIDRDGKVLYLDLTFGPLHDERGEVVQIIGSGVDVTARREARMKLQQSNDRYRALVNNFPNGAVFLVDHDLRFLVAGGSELAQVGFTEEMLVGKTVAEAMPPPAAANITVPALRTLAGESLVLPETYGSLQYVVRTTPILDEHGQVVAAMLMTQNVTHEKEAEEGLRFYQFLVDNTEDPIYWISPEDNFRFSYVNRAACQHFGLPEDKLLTMSIPEWDPVFTWEKCVEFSALIREKKRMVFETQHRHGGGEVIPVELSVTLLFYQGKEYYAGYIKDLRERKKTEAALRESEERYATTVNASELGLWDFDVTRQTIVLSGQMARIFGCRANDEMTNEDFFDRLHPDDQQEQGKLFRAVLAGEVKSTFTTEHRIVQKNGGAVRWVRAVGKAFFDAQGAVYRTVGTVADITDRKAAALQVKALQEQLAVTVENIPSSVCLFDGDGQLLFANKPALEDFRCVLGEHYVPGEDLATLMEKATQETDYWDEAGQALPAAAAPVMVALTTGQPAERLLKRMHRRNGEARWIMGKAVPLRNESGVVHLLVSTATDVTVQKTAEVALRESEQRYRHLFESNEDPLFLVDLHTGAFMDANPAACQIYGYGRAELLRLKNTDISAEPEKTVHSMQEKDAAVRLRYHRKQDGTVFPVELVFTYLVIDGRNAALVAVRDITERMEASRKLEEEKQRLEMALTVASIGLWDMDAATSHTVYNERIGTILGIPATEMVPHANTWRRRIHPADAPVVDQAMRKHLTGEKPFFSAQYRIVRKDGTIRWVQSAGKVLAKDADGKPQRVIGTLLDVTERVEASTKLEEEKQRLEMALWGADLGMWDWHIPSGKVIRNERYEKMLGYEPGDQQSSADDWIQSLHPEDLAATSLALENYLAGKTDHYRSEHRLKSRSGGWVWTQASGKVVERDGAGTPIRMIGIQQDISERREVSRKLEEEKQRLELALAGADMGLWDWNVPTGEVIFDERWAAIIGFQPQEIRARIEACFDLIHPADLENVVQDLQPHLEGRSAFYRAEHRIRSKDGTWKWVLDSGKVIARDAEGNPLRMVGTHLDITPRKEAEVTIRELNAGLEQKVEERTAQLQAANKELEAFSYSVSHDLRSPLRSIDGFSKMLLDDYEGVLDGDGKEFLHTIRQATARMGHLIDDLLKLAKVSRAELSRFDVDLSEMATALLGELARETPQRQVSCRVTPGLVVHADHRLLHIALQNLLHNAWKYSAKKEAAAIEVGQQATPRGVAYFVQDNGAGFDMRNADKLFGAFQRLHTGREFEGTGIGLAIVQRIILKHGGEIWAEAVPDRGATFFFTLPGA